MQYIRRDNYTYPQGKQNLAKRLFDTIHSIAWWALWNSHKSSVFLADGNKVKVMHLLALKYIHWYSAKRWDNDPKFYIH